MAEQSLPQSSVVIPPAGGSENPPINLPKQGQLSTGGHRPKGMKLNVKHLSQRPTLEPPLLPSKRFTTNCSYTDLVNRTICNNCGNSALVEVTQTQQCEKLARLGGCAVILTVMWSQGLKIGAFLCYWWTEIPWMALILPWNQSSDGF